MLLALVFCVVVQPMLNSCSEDDSIASNVFVGEWRITSIQVSEATLNQLSPTEETISITFNADGSYSGNTSVNAFGGRYRLDGTNTLTLLEFMTTEVADTQFATAFYAAIEAAIVSDSTFAQLSYVFEGNTVRLTFGAEGEMVGERL